MTVLLAGLTAEAVGLAAATWADIWIGTLSADARVVAAGSDYLTTVGPMFGFFGIRMRCMASAKVRAERNGRQQAPVCGRRWLCWVASCLYLGAGVHSIFLAVAIGMASFGSLALPGLIRQSEFSKLPIG
jgi:MATE family, multidrug efflux pump